MNVKQRVSKKITVGLYPVNRTFNFSRMPILFMGKVLLCYFTFFLTIQEVLAINNVYGKKAIHPKSFHRQSSTELGWKNGIACKFNVRIHNKYIRNRFKFQRCMEYRLTDLNYYFTFTVLFLVISEVFCEHSKPQFNRNIH